MRKKRKPASPSFVILSTLLICSASSPIFHSAHAASPTIRVALFVDRGAEASEFIKEFERSDNDTILYKTVDGEDISGGALKSFDALLVPGGSALKESGAMGPEARELVRRFVDEGGVYMGICAGAYLASSAAKTDIGMLPLKTLDADHWYRVDDMTKVSVELTPTGMDAFGIDKSNIRVGYENGPIFAPPDLMPGANNTKLTPLAYFRSEVVADGGERGAMLGAPAILYSKYGRGIVMVISPHFEETPGYKQVQLHALRWLYDHRDTASQPGAIASAAPTRPTEHKVESHGPVDKLQPKENHSLANEKSNAMQKSENNQKTEVRNSSNSSATPGDGSTIGTRALKLAESIFENASVVRYSHRQVIAARQVMQEDNGTLDAITDCSGFISYIVHAVAPKHYHVIRTREPDASYPQAKIWANYFDTLETDNAHDGWISINNWRDLSSGDIIAWKEGNGSSSGNTGHVMMVMSKPGEVKEENGNRFFDVQVIDSSSVYHFAPEHLPPKAGQEHRNGLGEGCVRIMLSSDNKPVGYWAGTYWGEGNKPVKGPTISNMVRFARMVPLEESDR